MPAAGGKGKPKNYGELSDDTKALREEKQVPPTTIWLPTLFICQHFCILFVCYSYKQSLVFELD